MDQHYFRSASNSLLARTADRKPKTFALQGDPNRSTFPPSSKRIYSPNRDIEKIPAPLRSHISPPKTPNLSPSCQICRQGQGTRRQSSHTYPCKTLFPTIRLTLLGSDFPCL
ncbi:hypothetical protein AVEN_139283-1 [Araneus ventricosus]|uniref:Uncharacterized protein n=1 Tax=Araneus ventricosus TaxID=182803 RepID=A0A4Y2NMC6_ARAVE|nr:hypothetical protein AVEN_139283-1 [Araneus ventricosus]